MISLIAFILNAKFLLGLLIGAIGTFGYFSYTGSTINFVKPKK